MGNFLIWQIDCHLVRTTWQSFCKLRRSFHILHASCSQHPKWVGWALNQPLQPKGQQVGHKLASYSTVGDNHLSQKAAACRGSQPSQSFTSTRTPWSRRSLLPAGIRWLQLCAAEGEERGQHPPRGWSLIWKQESPFPRLKAQIIFRAVEWNRRR